MQRGSPKVESGQTCTVEQSFILWDRCGICESLTGYTHRFLRMHRHKTLKTPSKRSHQMARPAKSPGVSSAAQL